MKRILICLFALLCAVQGTWATDYVTDVMLIGAGKSINNLKKQYQNEGWTLIDYDLNKGAGGSYIYMHVTYPQVNSYPYLKRSWNAEKKRVDKTVETCTNFTLLDGSNYELYNGWYVVGSNVEYKKCIEIRGDDVNLIVADGMSLNASEAIRIHKDCKLKIYGQRAETGKVYPMPTAVRASASAML